MCASHQGANEARALLSNEAPPRTVIGRPLLRVRLSFPSTTKTAGIDPRRQRPVRSEALSTIVLVGFCEVAGALQPSNRPRRSRVFADRKSQPVAHLAVTIGGKSEQR